MTTGSRGMPRPSVSPERPSELGEISIEPISVRIAVAVKLTGIPRSTLYELIGAGQIKTVKIGRSTFIPYRCLKGLIDK